MIQFQTLTFHVKVLVYSELDMYRTSPLPSKMSQCFYTYRNIPSSRTFTHPSSLMQCNFLPDGRPFLKLRSKIQIYGFFSLMNLKAFSLKWKYSLYILYLTPKSLPLPHNHIYKISKICGNITQKLMKNISKMYNTESW